MAPPLKKLHYFSTTLRNYFRVLPSLTFFFFFFEKSLKFCWKKTAKKNKKKNDAINVSNKFLICFDFLKIVYDLSRLFSVSGIQAGN